MAWARYVDARFTRWIQPELEVRFLRFNEFTCYGQCAGIDENTYSIGERVPIKTFHKFTPYGKVLVGLGNGSWLTGNALVLTYGGGVDYQLNRKFTIRCADFEYQQWPVSSTNGSFSIWPYGLSAGIELQDLLENREPREQAIRRRFFNGTAACVFTAAFLYRALAPCPVLSRFLRKGGSAHISTRIFQLSTKMDG